MMSNLTGTTLGGRYRFEALIGEGTFARVYRVYDLKRGVDLAAKVLRSDVSHERTFVERFRREAQVLARLQHPHIVRYYDVAEVDGAVFILMDYIDGTTLHSHLYHLNRPLSVRETLQFLRPISTALTFAHGENIIHRDIKPGNILLSKSGLVYVTDFGIAHLLDDAGTLTQGMSIGTPLYMAPEQIMGKTITLATDIYAMGVLLYRMLTGEVPFAGKNPQAQGATAAERVAYEHVNLPPTRPSQLNPSVVTQAVEDVILVCLRKDPLTRFPSAVAVHDALAETIGAPPAGVEPVELDPRTIAPPDVKLPEWSRVMGKVDAASQFNTLDPSQQPPGTMTGSKQTMVHQPQVPPAPGGYQQTQPGIPPAKSTQPHMQPVQVPPPYVSPYESAPSYAESEVAPAGLDTSQPWFWVVVGLGAIFVIAICLGAIILGFGLFSGDEDKPTPTQSSNAVLPGGGTANRDRVFIYAGLSGTNLDIYRANIDGTGVTRLTTTTTNESAPKFSPDGSQIAYHAYEGTTGPADIWIMSANGTNQRRITTTASDERNVTWSPDGTKIAYQSNATGRYDIYLYDLTSGESTNLTKSNFNDMAPAWSPDGVRIAFQSDQNGGYEIFIINTDGTGRTDVTEGLWEEAINPDWVFDASRLVFTAGSEGDYQLYAINPDAGGFQELFALKNNNRFAAWSTVGVKMLFMGGATNNPDIFLTDFTTGRTTKVVSNGFFPDWSP